MLGAVGPTGMLRIRDRRINGGEQETRSREGQRGTEWRGETDWASRSFTQCRLAVLDVNPDTADSCAAMLTWS